MELKNVCVSEEILIQTDSSVELFTYSVVYSLTHSLNHTLAHSVTHSRNHSVIHSLTQPFTQSKHSLTYSLIHSLSLTHSLTTRDQIVTTHTHTRLTTAHRVSAATDSLVWRTHNFNVLDESVSCEGDSE